MTPTKLETLRAVRELLSDPSRWTRGAYARDAEGNYANASGPNAVCWCAVGAFEKVTGYKSGAISRSIDSLLRLWGFDPTELVERNDGPNNPEMDVMPRPAPARHRNLLAYLDKLIAAEEAK